MKSFQSYVDQMNQLLNELIQVAKDLLEASQKVISEKELAPLQKRQDEILAQLESVDGDLHRYYGTEIKSSVHQEFQRKLKEFQQINQEFISNLNASHGLIQFEIRSLTEEGAAGRQASSQAHPTNRKHKK